MNVVDEQIDVTTRSILALTVACARCHDHKFDPIPTTDYYALAGIFRSTKTFSGKGLDNSDKKLNLVNERFLRVLGSDAEAQLERLGEEIDRAREQLAAGTEARAGKEELKKLEARLKDLQSDRLSSLQVAMAVGDVDSPEDCHVLVRGEIDERGERVPRGMVSAVRVARPMWR